MGFQIDLESDNTQARAALGRSGKRVPLIASDALTDGEFDSTWPIVGVKTGRKWKLLGDSHSVYWRKDLPEFISQAVGSFVDHALTAAEVMQKRPGASIE